MPYVDLRHRPSASMQCIKCGEYCDIRDINIALCSIGEIIDEPIFKEKK
jgi:hypothetical protein